MEYNFHLIYIECYKIDLISGNYSKINRIIIYQQEKDAQ